MSTINVKQINSQADILNPFIFRSDSIDIKGNQVFFRMIKVVAFPHQRTYEGLK